MIGVQSLVKRLKIEKFFLSTFLILGLAGSRAWSIHSYPTTLRRNAKYQTKTFVQTYVNLQKQKLHIKTFYLGEKEEIFIYCLPFPLVKSFCDKLLNPSHFWVYKCMSAKHPTLWNQQRSPLAGKKNYIAGNKVRGCQVVPEWSLLEPMQSWLTQ